MRFLRRQTASVPGTARYSAELEQRHLSLLSENDLFQGLGPEEMAALAGRLPMSTCRRGQTIYEPEETGEALFILKTGNVRIFRLAADGRKLVIATLEPGTAFGEMSVLGQSMSGSFAEATDDCTICIMSRVDIEQIMLEHPTVALRMVAMLSTRLKQAEDRLARMVFTPVPVRLARLLLERAIDDEVTGDSHQDLADMIGTARETVSRALVEMKGAGMLEIDRRCVKLLDRQALERLAEQD